VPLFIFGEAGYVVPMIGSGYVIALSASTETPIYKYTGKGEQI